MDFQIPRINLLRAFITDRLTVAADEIFDAVEKVLGEYQEEARRTTDENGRLQRQDLASKPEKKRDPQNHGAEEVGPGQQLWEQGGRISLGQENPEPTPVKEEEEPLWTAEEEEQLPGLDSDTNDFRLTSPCVTTNFDQFQHQPASLYLSQAVEHGEMTPWDSQRTRTGQQIKSEPEVHGYIGPAGTLASTSDSLHPAVVTHDSADGVGSSGLLQSVSNCLNPRRDRNKRLIFPKPLPFQTGESSHRHNDSLTGVKSHQCNACGKCFKVKSDLNRHMMLHTGEKPFKCKNCGKCFNRKYNLTSHVKMHTGTELFECKECGKCLKRKDRLKRHMMKHIRTGLSD